MSKNLIHKRFDSTASDNQFAKIFAEVLMLLFLAISIFLLIALISYNQSDGGWSHTGYSLEVNNMAGKVGAWFSDILLYFFGYISYLFPILLTYGVTLLFLSRNEDFSFNFKLFVVRSLGFIITLSCSCAIVSLAFTNYNFYIPVGAGGVVGNVLGLAVLSLFNIVGSVLFLTVLLLIGITLFADISWLNITHYLIRLKFAGIMYVGATIKRFFLLLKERIKKESNIAIKFPTVRKKFKVTKRKDPIKAKKIIARKSIKDYKNNQSLPSFNLLDIKKANIAGSVDVNKLNHLSEEVENKLKDFGIEVKVVAVHPGPVITRFEMQIAPGIKASKITSLAKDLARSLSVVSVRVVEVIPGKTVVGLEIPNDSRETVLLSEVLVTEEYSKDKAVLGLALGKDISGNPIIVDLEKMPHLLVAGTTGSGKSVGINAMILSLLYKHSPENVRLILVDPKMLELAVYEDIPHLLAPVVTDMREAANALRWCVAEMEKRYSLMAQCGVRNIAGYNKKIVDNQFRQKLEDQLNFENEMELKPLPYIVIVIDEFADMMMVVGKKVEQLIARLAQKARAAGIHMILATQRPSVDVITGLIKSNIPTRISFQVSSKIDSRTILDQQGADQLLGHGDMLYLPPGMGLPIRVHGAFVADHEVHNVAKALKKKGKPDYLSEITDYTQNKGYDDNNGFGAFSNEDAEDEFYSEAIDFIKKTKKVSISSIQRRFKIGYNRAARIVEQMEGNGVVSPMEANGSREVLI